MPRARKCIQPVDPVVEICSKVIPKQEISAENFWRLCREYPSRDAAMVYVYRLKPKIDRTLTGHEQSNIAKWPLDETVTENRLAESHGNGLFYLRLTDSNRPKPLVEVAASKIEIDRPDMVPVVDHRELVNCEENAGYIQWCRAKGIRLPFDDQEESMPTPDGVAVQAMAGLTREVLEELRESRRQAPAKDTIALAIEAEKAFGGRRDSVADMLKIVEVFGGAHAEGSKTTELLFGTMTRLLELQMAAATQQRPKSDLEHLRELLALARELRGAGGGESGWGALAASLPGALSGLAQVLDRVAAVKAAGAHVPGGGLPAVRSPSSGSATASTKSGESMPMIAQLIAVGQKAVGAFEQGLGGDEFAQALYVMQPEVYEALAQMRKKEILGMLRSQPELWAQLEPRSQEVEKFIEDFVSYSDQEGEAAPGAAPAVEAE